VEIDPEELDRRSSYRLMISVIVPRPIALVSTLSPEGRANLAPFSFFNGVSSKPPVLSIAVGSRRGERKDTWRNIESTGEFVVNVVVPGIVDPMVASSKDFPPEVDEIRHTGLTPIPGRIVKPPRIAESPVNLECRLERIVEVAGTGLILGRVVLYHVRDDLLENGRVDPRKLEPVARLGDDFYGWLGGLFEKPRPR
jgi:flavin reductase (DIM6/NTAB) family NADH-FMN oxidoreductase RutF